jgi:hypothetical protein
MCPVALLRLGRRPAWPSGRSAQHARSNPSRLWGGKPDAHEISDAEGVLELLWLLLTTVLTWARPRQDLVLENLLLCHQLVSAFSCVSVVMGVFLSGGPTGMDMRSRLSLKRSPGRPPGEHPVAAHAEHRLGCRLACPRAGGGTPLNA